MLGLQRISNVLSTHWLRCMYSSSVTATKGSNKLTDVSVSAESTDKKPKSRIVAAAFESLKDDNDSTSIKVVNTFAATSTNSNIINLDERIASAKTVNGLLSVSENGEPISRKHALRIVSILAEWSSANRVKLSEFENDSRFIKVCKILGRTFPKNGNPLSSANSNNNNNKRVSGFRTDDLNTVLGVAGDDEAAKLIASISVPQMVKVMSTLAQRKRRSTPLLRSLAYNISSSTEQLDIKQCADVLFAMACLNFQDSVLAAKMCSDIQAALPAIKEKSAVVGSIITSLGILKYRDLDIMEALTQWILKNIEVCRPQDLSAYFITSAVLNFQTTSFDEVKLKLVKCLVKEDFAKKIDWLNHVWALGLLNLAEATHLESVLNEEFVNQLQAETSGLTPNAKMKLLNLNSISKLLVKNCNVQLNEGAPVFDLHIAHSKSKQIMFNGLLDALKSLLPSSNHVQSHVDTKMGFYIDALCAFDAKRNPLPLDKDNPDAIKVALMLVDFHDICNGPHRSTSGIVKLSFDLLEKCGYKVLPVPYNEFSTSDKLLKRVQYLEGKIKSIVRVTN